MKNVLKLSGCLLFALLAVLIVLNLQSLPVGAKLSVTPAVSGLRQQENAFTYTLYLPIIHRPPDFIYGIYPDPSNYSSNISNVQDLGLGWVKMQMPWKDVEFAPGEPHWGAWDSRIEAYHEAGINVLLVLTKAPNWARPADDDRGVEGLPENPQTYVTFVLSVTERYSGKVQAIEVWDQQNLYYMVGGQGRVSAANYMELLGATYDAVKAEHPEITVVSGGLVPTGAPLPWAVDDRVYLRQMYALGLKDHCDAVGAMPSGFANPPDSLWPEGDLPNQGYDDHPSFFFRNTMEDYRRIIIDAGDEDKKIWATEFGWAVWRCTLDDRFTYAKQTSLEEQAQYIRRAYEMGKAWGWVGAMFLWNLDYALTAPNTELANFSILDSGGPTPAYEAVRDMPKP